MYNQEKITKKEEYEPGMAESENMNFVFKEATRDRQMIPLIIGILILMIQDVVSDLSPNLDIQKKMHRI